MGTANGKWVIGGCLVLFTVGMGLVPALFKHLHTRAGNNGLQNSKKPLTGSQKQRGMYVQAGQQDIGPDPDWVNGVYMPNRKHKTVTPTAKE